MLSPNTGYESKAQDVVQYRPVDNAPVVKSLHSLSHAEEAVLDIVSALLPASAIRQPILYPIRWLLHTQHTPNCAYAVLCHSIACYSRGPVTMKCCMLRYQLCHG